MKHVTTLAPIKTGGKRVPPGTTLDMEDAVAVELAAIGAVEIVTVVIPPQSFAGSATVPETEPAPSASVSEPAKPAAANAPPAKPKATAKTKAKEGNG